MVSIYKEAEKNFEEAANILLEIQNNSLDLKREAENVIIDGRKLNLLPGYNDITPSFGIGLPAEGRGELSSVRSDSSVTLHCNNAEWVSLEGRLVNNVLRDTLYIELKISGCDAREIDVFIRHIFEEGGAEDCGHLKCHLDVGSLNKYKVEVPIAINIVKSNQIVILFHRPEENLTIDYLRIHY